MQEQPEAVEQEQEQPAQEQLQPHGPDQPAPPELAPQKHHIPVVRIAAIVLVGAAVAVLFGAGTPPVLDWLYSIVAKQETHLEAGVSYSIAAASVLGFLVGSGFANLVIGWFGLLGRKWTRLDSGDKVTLFLGVFIGLLASTPFLLFFINQLNRIPPIYFPFVILALIGGFVALCIYVLNSMSDILPWTKTTAKGKRTGAKLLDTNVIIDGRVYDVARAGFIEGQLYVPGFVLDELQHIADSHDALRRQRGRRGLEILRNMQSAFPMEVRVMDRLAPDTGEGVDARLVRLARAMGGDIITGDWNLNRVAALQEVRVLNINDLALALRPNVLPSEMLRINIVKEGNQPQQGVGYLEDGTMVVVENGKAHMNETLDVSVTQVIQTERGKMIFAVVGDDPHAGPPHAPDLPRKMPGNHNRRR